MKKVIFPGTFDPLTNGHLDLIMRASELFSTVIVAVAKDTNKQAYFTFEERLLLVKSVLKSMPTVEVKGFSGFLVDFYQAESASAVIRGVRHASDFEYEFQLAQVNEQLSAGGVRTLFLPASTPHLFVSASMVREIARLGGDVKPFVPKEVAAAFLRRFT